MRTPKSLRLHASGLRKELDETCIRVYCVKETVCSESGHVCCSSEKDVKGFGCLGPLKRVGIFRVSGGRCLELCVLGN